ncbi:hypothetical protein A3F03_02115 [Candidatus Roizmanbacteria bacterium RIFCSPHIGHO2_12_FULL_41_11]|uniref:Phosphoribosyltransferase domain-containing protein n=3 Tax=Candidatus Roizmaniibacteriota TaxID=1752723 RepID=A0A1F7JQY4_9BACT|nr:MAG: hypothetical protein A3F03_02115 [Candidatus Roizmanbacteria bacterium RIFCSPHIGHO2_12_FULL_41_11]OGK51147.1 MAG: hypothetical protein A2966_00200 [Candidatus Roizmanbacteria bacterium RIFCSPLOWO2_01_FULL_41_22]OGK58005.1 MAG: hypothetical protein A3H86_00750 [Candidatus Roizmanbacteria bacterium RIFCSPLOWO2_02_FULL_41_9]
MNEMKFIKISWTQFAKDCISLTKRLEDKKIDKIVAITRGGLVVARILSDLLDVPISHITIASYANLQQQKVPRVTEASSNNYHGQTILITDEVSDTGHTFKRALSYFENLSVGRIYTLATYIKPKTIYTPDFYQRTINAWIIFPYEIKETADAFMKMYKDKNLVKKKLTEVGYEPWEIVAVIDKHS